MTKEEYNKLPVGTVVWFKPAYFAFAMPGVIKTTLTGGRGIWVNFFGDGQCLFTPQDYNEKHFYECVTIKTTRREENGD
ncbi:MAG: hypothetical protein J5746_13560 [Victivallales bacterium]|nr:hypothetical protein [Victivallales bacterium]